MPTILGEGGEPFPNILEAEAEELGRYSYLGGIAGLIQKKFAAVARVADREFQKAQNEEALLLPKDLLQSVLRAYSLGECETRDGVGDLKRFNRQTRDAAAKLLLAQAKRSPDSHDCLYVALHARVGSPYPLLALQMARVALGNVDGFEKLDILRDIEAVEGSLKRFQVSGNEDRSLKSFVATPEQECLYRESLFEDFGCYSRWMIKASPNDKTLVRLVQKAIAFLDDETERLRWLSLILVDTPPNTFAEIVLMQALVNEAPPANIQGFSTYANMIFSGHPDDPKTVARILDHAAAFDFSEQLCILVYLASQAPEGGKRQGSLISALDAHIERNSGARGFYCRLVLDIYSDISGKDTGVFAQHFERKLALIEGGPYRPDDRLDEPMPKRFDRR